jgi:hypothetical protein
MDKGHGTLHYSGIQQLLRKKLYPSESEVENLTWFGSLGDRDYNPCKIDTGFNTLSTPHITKKKKDVQ